MAERDAKAQQDERNRLAREALARSDPKFQQEEIERQKRAEAMAQRVRAHQMKKRSIIERAEERARQMQIDSEAKQAAQEAMQQRYEEEAKAQEEAEKREEREKVLAEELWNEGVRAVNVAFSHLVVAEQRGRDCIRANALQQEFSCQAVTTNLEHALQAFKQTYSRAKTIMKLALKKIELKGLPQPPSKEVLDSLYQRALATLKEMRSL